MKVAIASTGLGHIARGIESWARDLAAALHARGVNVTLFKGSGAAVNKYERVVNCIPRNSWLGTTVGKLAPPQVWRIGWANPYQIEQTTFARKIIPQLVSGKYDLIHLQDPWLALTLLRQRTRHATHVLYMNGTDEPLDFIDQFSYVQEQSPPYVQRHGEQPGKLRFCIPSFVDSQIFAPADRRLARQQLGLPLDDFVVLSVGALRRTGKRMDWLVQEFQQVPGKLVIAGAHEPETPAFVAMARQKLGNRVIVLENVSHSQMPALYRSADVLALCSLKEIFGLAFVEAMACGTPCVGHVFPVTEWIIGDGGECVDMEKSGELACILSKYRDESYRTNRGAAAKIRAVTTFSQEAVIPQMLAMYRTILG